MPRRRPDRALKRAVRGLARLHPDDVEAILGALDPGDRARVDAMVAGFAGRPLPVAAAPEPEQPEWAYESVSPWLLARIDPDDRRAAREFVLMTETGREALRAAAEPFRKPVSAPGAGKARSLLDQAWRLVAGARP
ncbi:MAG TPA: hypothetical protein VGW40_14960 [Allosphingosinicella sp.]|nr:hypothetical protein [Allosphingosinicella sp.]